MQMKFKRIIPILLLAASFSTAVVFAQESATPSEVVEKVQKAAEFLEKNGEKGLPEFMDKDGRWVFKDTYVWVLNCNKGINATHVIKPKLVGKNLMGLKDITGKLFFAEFCQKAKNENGGWVEYQWPKVGERETSRKITYILNVKNTPYQVAAGIYDENVSLRELNRLIQ